MSHRTPPTVGDAADHACVPGPGVFSWLRDIMQRNERPLDMATTKLLSVREQFAEENFNWTLMEQLALSQLQVRATPRHGPQPRVHDPSALCGSPHPQNGSGKDRERTDAWADWRLCRGFGTCWAQTV